MPKFRKKPTVVEAVQWFKAGDHPEVKQFHRVNHPHVPLDSDYYWGIDTFEGTMNVSPGDWIVGPGAEGEFWPVKPSVFEKTYEPVEGE
jgi:hypothetical protein